MQERRIGTQRSVRLLPSRGLWIFLLAGLFTVALTQRPEAGVSFAQSASQQSSEKTGNGAGAQAIVPDQAAKQDAHDAAADPNANQNADQHANPEKNQIAAESADLLKLANSLKAEVDKTTPDTLSVTVVRQAAAIEKLAHQMRTK
jgi:hypothetical protein